MNFITSGPVASIWASVLLAAIMLIAAGAGRRLLGLVRIPDGVFLPSEAGLYSLMLGLTSLSLAILIIGWLVFLNAAVLWAVLAVFGLLAVPRRGTRFFKFDFKPPSSRLILTVIALILFLSWLQALAPAIGMDALSYHLEHPRQFLMRHRIGYVPYTRESLWAYQTEMLFTLGLGIQGATLAVLFHWAYYPLTAWGMYVLAMRLAGPRAALRAALFFMLTPVAFAQSGYAYVDLALAFYTLLSVNAFVAFSQDEAPSLALLCGLAAGAAAGTKYLGLASAIVLAVLLAVRFRFRPGILARFLAGCALAGGIWYLRSWIVIGNPVYPFFRKFFGSGFDFDIAANVGMGSGLRSFALLLWRMTMHPMAFGGQMLGPLFLLFLPCVFLVWPRRWTREAAFTIVFGVFYTFLLFKLSQHLRFYLSIAALLSVGSAWVFCRLREARGWVAAIAAGALAALVVLHLGIFTYRLRSVWRVDAGLESARAYLEAHERSFRAYEFLQERVKPGETFFNDGEVRYFYNPVPGMAFSCTPLKIALKSRGLTISDYVKRQGFDYILYEADEGGWDPVVRELAKAGVYRLAYQYDFYEKPASFHYEVYQKVK